MRLRTYVLRRVAMVVAITLLVSAISFLFTHLAPGGPAQALGGQFATPDQLEQVRRVHGLDRPLPVQYLNYLQSLATLDLGTSLSTREPVVSALASRAAVSVPLVTLSLVLTMVIGTALGLIAALRPGGTLDRAIVGVSVIGASSPPFATAILFLLVFAVLLGWLPAFGEGTGLIGRARHLVLPVATLTVAGVASMLKIARVRFRQALAQDHITFARARGLSSRYLLMRGVVRNAGIQIVTTVGVLVFGLVAGAIVVEEAFGLNGLGAYFIDAIAARDIPVVQGITMLITFMIVSVNLLIDLLYFALDPRVRVAGGTA